MSSITTGEQSVGSVFAAIKGDVILDMAEEEDTNKPRKRARPSESPTPTTPPPPRPGPNTADRISELSDDIIQRILEFLPIKDTIRTVVLSRRWRSAWTAVSNLFLRDQGYYIRNVADFVAFIDKILVRYQPVNLKKFLVDFKFSSSFGASVDSWVHFAIAHGVEDLALDFRSGEDYATTNGIDRYPLPGFAYSDVPSMTKLSLRFCNLSPDVNTGIYWTSLKVLSIAYATLTNELIEVILLGSPVLEVLKLVKCTPKESKQIRLGSKTLKELVIDGFSDTLPVTLDELEISGPNLVSLAVVGYVHTVKCKLLEVSSLKEVNIGFQIKTFDRAPFSNQLQYKVMLEELLQKLHHVDKLRIGNWCLQFLSTRENFGYPCLECKSLVLDTVISKLDLPGIARLLVNSPFLEKLSISMTPFNNFPQLGLGKDYHGLDRENNWRSLDGLFGCLQDNVSSIEIVGFDPRCSSSLKLATELVQFLLRNAKVLEKMVIHADRNGQDRSWTSVSPEEIMQYLKLTEQLLCYPRASSKAVIQFNSYLK